MTAKSLASLLPVALVITGAIGGTRASALTITAETGIFQGNVTVKDEGKNTTLYVWQTPTSTKPTNGSDYVSTGGFFLTTDNNGNGSVSIPNTSSGRLFNNRWVGLFGNNEDNDTFLYGPAQVNGKPFTDKVPSPLPVAGVAAVLYHTRKLKKRISLGRSALVSTTIS